MSEAFFRNLYSKCKMHGTGEAQVVISDGELKALLSIAIDDLGWPHDDLGIHRVNAPSDRYYEIPMAWFDEQSEIDIQASSIV